MSILPDFYYAVTTSSRWCHCTLVARKNNIIAGDESWYSSTTQKPDVRLTSDTLRNCLDKRKLAFANPDEYNFDYVL